MLYTHVIDPDYVIKGFDNNADNFYDNLAWVLRTLEKKSIYIDCDQCGLTKEISEYFKKIFNDDDVDQELKKKMMEFFIHHINNYQVYNTNCSCEEGDCNLNKNVETLKAYQSTLPTFVISDKNDLQCELVNLTNYSSSEKFSKIDKDEPAIGTVPRTKQDSINFLTNEIGDIVEKCKQIVIYDRNIWCYWGDDFMDGLEILLTVVSQKSPNCFVNIYTQYTNGHKNDANTSSQDIYRYIKEFLEEKSNNIYLRFNVCNEKTLNHFRLIELDQFKTCIMDRGITEFVPSKRAIEDKTYHVDFKDTAVYHPIILNAGNEVIEEEDFKPIILNQR